MTTHRFAALVLCLLTALSSSALQVGPELAVQEPALEPPPGVRSAPLTASNGEGFLVVWNDWRGGPNAGEVRAARVDRNGAVLDGQSRLVASNAGVATSVASNGRDYLIAYNCSNESRPDLCLARVDALTGAVTRAATIDDGNSGVLASNGNGYLLVYPTGTLGSMQRLAGVALREDGSPVRTPFTIGNSPYAASVATNGEHYFVVWSTYAQLEGALVSDSAVIGTRQSFVTTNPSFGPGAFAWSVASDGNTFLVAWQHNKGVAPQERYTTELRVAPVSASGVASASQAVVGEHAWQPALAWKGTDYLLTYTHSTTAGISPSFGGAEGDVRALALTSSGAPVAGTTYAGTAARESGSSIAAARGATLVAWQNEQRRDVHFIEGRLAESGNNFVIATAPAWQQNVSLDRRSSHTVVAWEEISGPAQRSRVRLHQYETSLAPQLGRATFDVAASPRHQRRPVVKDGMIAWVEEELDGSKAGVWYQALDFNLGRNIAPVGPPQRVGDAKVGTELHILRTHVFHVILWTAPDGRIAGVYRSLVARIGYDPSVFYVTNDAGLNPASDGHDADLIAYNNPITSDNDVCLLGCRLPWGVRVTRLSGRVPQPALDIAPAGARAPRVVKLSATESLIFWSMDESEGTFMQRVSTGGGTLALVGGPRQIHDGLLHDATLGKDDEVYVAVEEQDRYAVLRLDRNLNVVETIPFTAQLTPGARIEIAADRFIRPVLAYEAVRENDGASSRVVLRLVDDHFPVPKRRSAR